MSKRNRHAQKDMGYFPIQPAEVKSEQLAAYARQIESSCHLVHEDHAGNTSLMIFSQQKNLSEAEITDFLVTAGVMYWGRLFAAGATEVVYVGGYFDPAQTAAGRKIPHTYVRIAWPCDEKGTLADRLRRLEHSESGACHFWEALVGAVLAAECCNRKTPDKLEDDEWNGAPAIFAGATAYFSHSPGRAVSKKEARRLAQDCLKSIPPDVSQLFAPYELGAISTAQMLLALGELLWEPDIRLKMARRCGEYAQAPDVWKMLARLANSWLHLVVRDHWDIDVSGGRLRLGPDEEYDRDEWQQVMELERWHIPVQALHYLKGRRKTGERLCMSIHAPGYDPVYGNALAEQLLEDAHQNVVFVPSGAFRLLLPAGMPVANFQELCLWTDGKGLWVLPKPGGVIFYWRPEHPTILTAPFWGSLAASAMHLTLSALWRDLVVGGEQVFAQLSHERVASPAAKPFDRLRAGNRRKPSARQKSQPVLYVPSARRLDLEGHCAWGTPEEVEKIRRRAHQVRGHVRRLLPGQKAGLQAKENAERFGFLIPSGHTFVRPHTAGLKSEDEEVPETRIVACGLASLLVMSSSRMERAK